MKRAPIRIEWLCVMLTQRTRQSIPFMSSCLSVVTPHSHRKICISHAHGRSHSHFLLFGIRSNYLQFITRTIEFIPLLQPFQSIILQYFCDKGRATTITSKYKCIITTKLIVTLRLHSSHS